MDSLTLEGTKQVEADEIKEKISTQESSWIPLIGSKSHFDPAVWRTDLQRIERYYRERGYYQAKVVESRVLGEDGSVNLRVEVDEGEPARVGAIDQELKDKLESAGWKERPG